MTMSLSMRMSRGKRKRRRSIRMSRGKRINPPLPNFPRAQRRALLNMKMLGARRQPFGSYVNCFILTEQQHNRGSSQVNQVNQVKSIKSIKSIKGVPPSGPCCVVTFVIINLNVQITRPKQGRSKAEARLQETEEGPRHVMSCH